MTTMRLLIALGIVAGWSGTAFAAERTATQKAFGGVQTADGIVSGSAQVVTGVSFSCGGTACVFSLYDTATNGDFTNAKGFFEDGAAANTGKYVALDPPIRTTTGVGLNVDANVNGVVVFVEQATP